MNKPTKPAFPLCEKHKTVWIDKQMVGCIWCIIEFSKETITKLRTENEKLKWQVQQYMKQEIIRMKRKRGGV